MLNYVLIATSDTRLDRSINNEDIKIQGFNCDILQSDNPSDTGNSGGVCLYYKENIPIKSRNDLEVHDGTVVAEISLRRKKVFFRWTCAEIVLYSSHHDQNTVLAFLEI